jgi:hypothetical protein
MATVNALLIISKYRVIDGGWLSSTLLAVLTSSVNSNQAKIK